MQQSDAPPPTQPALDEADRRAGVEATREKAAQISAGLDPNRLPMWTVYGPNHPLCPGIYSARLWFSLPFPQEHGALVRANTLAELREILPPWGTCLGREPGDDPTIVETWIL